jgi:UDP-N-acetylmuramoylalanine--D-glutamate ligase
MPSAELTSAAGPPARLADLAGKRVALWGTGREGVAAALALRDLPGVRLVGVDDKPGRSVADWEAAVGPVPLVAGDGAATALSTVDVVLRSPGISRYHPLVATLEAAGTLVTSGTTLWMAEHAAVSVGVTGSKGKSTTSSLVHQLMAAVGLPAVYGGNIGIPMLSLPPAQRYVLELSSYQCSDLRSPLRVAAVTTLFPDHLDWHGSVERYYADKLNILAQQPAHAVLNGLSDELVARVTALGLDTPVTWVGRPGSYHLAAGPDGEPWYHLGTLPLFPRARLRLLGGHNAGNVNVALGVLDALGVDVPARRDALAEAVAAFEPLPYRLTPIEDPSGVLFVDDPLATTPQATIAAIEAFAGRPLTVLVGGNDRGVDYTPLREFLAARQPGAGEPLVVVGMPDSGPRILGVLAGVAGVELVASADLADAVRLARELTPVGGVVLLSPAAPSYGRFANYEHRSAAYREAIAATAS